MYLYVRVDDWDILTIKRKQHPSAGDDANTAEAAPGRVERRVKRGTSSKHHAEWLTLPRAKAFRAQNLV